MENENYSPYCKNCESCGIDECCTYLFCFSKLIENSECEYGKGYLQDAEFAKQIQYLAEEVINNLENGLFDSKLAVEHYRKKWNIIYDKTYL